MSKTLTESADGPWETGLPAPEDGDRVTADLAGQGEGPVNPGFQELLDRDAQLVLATTTLKSLTVDGMGEQATASTPGLIATTGDVLAVGLILAGLAVNAGTEHFTGTGDGEIHLSQIGALWDNVTDLAADGPNPARDLSIPNQLRAINTPKCWAILRSADGGFPGYFVDGCGFTGASLAAGTPSTFTFTMAQAMASADYLVVPVFVVFATRAYGGWSNITRLSATQFEVSNTVDISLTNYELMVLVFGRQDS